MSVTNWKERAAQLKLNGQAFINGRRVDAVSGATFDNEHEAHSAIYDAERTAELFCQIVNRWQDLGGWAMEDDLVRD